MLRLRHTRLLFARTFALMSAPSATAIGSLTELQRAIMQ